MKKSDQLKQQRAAKAEAAQALIDLAAPTAEQTTQAKALVAEVAAFASQIDAQITIEAALIDRPATPAAAGPALAPGIDAAAAVDFSRFRAGPLKHFKNEKDAYLSGQFFLAALFKNAKAKEWCAANGVPLVSDAHVEGVNSAGGYLVPTVLENTIIDLRDTYGIARKYVKILPMSSNEVNVPVRLTGLTAYPTAETAVITESTKGWGRVSLTARKWAVITRYSSELAEDAIISIAQDLTQEIAYAFAVAEDNALFNGDGTSTYAGISGLYRRFFDANVGTFIGAPSAAATHNTYGEIDADDIDTLMATLPAYARPGAAFYVSPQGKSLLFDPLLRAAGGNTQGDLSNGWLPKYMGHPIIEIVAMSNVPTYDFDEKPIMYFGHMSMAVMMGTRRGVTIATSPDVYFTTDEIAIRGTERFDINVHSIGDATTAGPLVALIGEAS